MGRTKGSKNKKQNSVENERRDTKKSTYFLTINNPTPEELAVKERLTESEFGDKIKYCKFALEEGEGEQTPHIHIALFLSEQQRFSAVKKVYPRARMEEELFGSNRQLIDYVGNPDFVYSEKRKDAKAGKRKGGTCTMSGEWGSTQGIRMGDQAEGSNLDSRLIILQDAIKEGASIMDLYEIDFPCVVRYTAAITAYHTAVNSLRVQGERRNRMVSAIEEAKGERKNFCNAITEQSRQDKQILREIEDSLAN